MRLLPRSIQGRLLALSAATTVIALAFAALTIGHVLERFVIRGLDQQLDAEAAMLVRAVRPDGRLDPARLIDLPNFAAARHGWGWRLDGPAGQWLGGDPPMTRFQHRGQPPPRPADDRALPGEGVSVAGEAVHLRLMVVPAAAGLVTITVGGPRRLALAPLREAMMPLLGSLGALGLALALATAVQLRIGLRPLRRLRSALADVRAGRVQHVPADQPAELAPLVAELNGLVDAKDAQLAQARRHVANLAHGLKTPLAALALQLRQGGRDPDGALATMVADIDARVRHHLGRARAATPGGGPPPSTALRPALSDLVAVMRGIHADRAIDTVLDVAPDLAVAVDPQDLDEMLGNLLDNAWRHARSRVTVASTSIGASVEIVIEDDGHGLSADATAEALLPGRRLDERGDGHGFGLPITAELAELNGGSLTLGSGTAGGLKVALTLPSTARST